MKHRLFSLIALLFAALLLFSSCGLVTENEDARELTEAFLDAVFANDSEAAYAVIAPGTNQDGFSQVFPKMVSLFEGAESYTLKQTGWHTSLNDGVQQSTMTYALTTNEENVFVVQSTFVEGYEGIYLINLKDTKWVTQKAKTLTPLNIGLIILSVLAIAFSVWMLVDCIKRKVPKKPLWILLILLGVNLSLTIMPERINFNWAIGLFLKLSGVNADIYQNLLTISALLPIGAIVYFIVRKHITKKEPKNNVIEGEAKEIESTPENP